jgi:hypothetical protein
MVILGVINLHEAKDNRNLQNDHKTKKLKNANISYIDTKTVENQYPKIKTTLKNKKMYSR